MDHSETMELLFQYASAYEFRDFSKSFHELKPALSPQELLDAHLMQAQIKLFAGDETLVNDLEEIEGIDASPRFPCLNAEWMPDSPNRFVVFNKTPDALRNFSKLLTRAGEELKRRYGEVGAAMARQVCSEILYFFGRFDDALRLAAKRRDKTPHSAADAVLSQYVRFRCYLAMGLHKEAEQCMLDMIRTTKSHPECLDPYRIVRDWANLTTGWSGDTLRFCDTPQGEALPVLEDRLAAIRQGISRPSPSEEPFVEYADCGYGDAYTMRRYYMDIFHAIYWFQAEDRHQAETYFSRAYLVSSATGLVMPFVEYGRQIVPLLRHAKESGTACSPAWITAILSLAEEYEKNLCAYRT